MDAPRAAGYANSSWRRYKRVVLISIDPSALTPTQPYRARHPGHGAPNAPWTPDISGLALTDVGHPGHWTAPLFRAPPQWWKDSDPSRPLQVYRLGRGTWR